MALDELSVDIETNAKLREDAHLWLKDDDDNTWFHGYVVYAKSENDVKTMHVRAQSELLYLDRKTMPAQFYDHADFFSAVKEVFRGVPAEVRFDDTVKAGTKIYGYCPKQSKRERLHHILFATGMYCKTAFVEHPTISKLRLDSRRNVPSRFTFYKPELTYRDYVTAITVTGFKFDKRQPTSGEESVKDKDGNVYVVTRVDATVKNQKASSVTPPKELEYNDIMLITPGTSDNVLNLLSNYYFDRTQIEFDCLNYGEFKPGMRLAVQLDDTQQGEGLAESVDFSFGTDVRSRIVMGECSVKPTHKLTIQYVSQSTPPGDIIIAERTYNFQEGTKFKVDNEYVDTTIGSIWYLFRPTTLYTEGTMGDTNMTKTVKCRVALKKDKQTGILTIVSVDKVTRRYIDTGDFYQAEID
jgi:hypothetical protein